jgi:hypothetical protein
MEPVLSSAGTSPAKQVVVTELPLYLGEPRPLRSTRNSLNQKKPSFLPLALLSAGALCLPLLNNVASAADVVGAAPAAAATISPSEAQSLRDEIRELREELKSVKGTTATNAATLKTVSEKVESAATQSDLEALRDIEDENTIRSIGSDSSKAYTINGNSHLVNLSGSAQLGYQAVLGPNGNQPSKANSGTSAQSFKINSISLGLYGYLRNDPGSEGDVSYNLGVLGTPNRYVAAGNTGLAAANTTPTGSVNGTYFGASDVWLQYDVKTTKLELEPAWTLSFKFGQFLTPYGVDNPSTEANRPTINQAQYISRLGFGRDIGAIATGGFINRNDPSASTVPLIGYTFGVFNGAGANTFDNNGGVDALARLVYNPFYQYSGNFRNLSFAANILEGNIGPNTDRLPTKRRFGGDIQWLRKPFLLTLEYVHSEDGYDDRSYSPLAASAATSIYPGPTAAFASSDNYVATLFWTPGTLPDFQPWVRFDRAAPTAFSDYTKAQVTAANYAGTGNIAKTAYSVGFNWFIWQLNPVTRKTYGSQQTERVLKLQVSYTYFDLPGSAAAANTKTPLANNQVDAALTFNF